MSSSLLYDTVEEKLDDYRPPHVRAADRMIEYFRDEIPAPGYGAPEPGRSREPETQVVDLPAAPTNPIDYIAQIMLSLTYSEMVELAAGLGRAPQDIHRWAESRRP